MYSNIRLLDAINRPGDLVDKAIRLGFKGIAITDHESLSCAVELLHIRDKIKKDNPDFKIIFGHEIYLVGEEDMNGYMDWYKNSKQRPLTQEEINSGEFGSWVFYTLDTNTMPKFRFYHFILWAKDAIGF
jgi:DNA polymerase III alpha subunit